MATYRYSKTNFSIFIVSVVLSHWMIFINLKWLCLAFKLNVSIMVKKIWTRRLSLQCTLVLSHTTNLNKCTVVRPWTRTGPFKQYDGTIKPVRCMHTSFVILLMCDDPLLNCVYPPPLSLLFPLAGRILRNFTVYIFMWHVYALRPRQCFKSSKM